MHTEVTHHIRQNVVSTRLTILGNVQIEVNYDDGTAQIYFFFLGEEEKRNYH